MIRTILLSIGLLAVAATACGPSRVALADEQESIDSARDSLSGSSYPWYDPAQDDLRRVELPVDADSVADPNAPSPDDGQDPQGDDSSPVDAGSDGVSVPVGAVSGVGSVFMSLFWFFIALVLVAVVALIIWAFMRREERQASGEELQSDTSREVDRLEELPFAVKRPQSNLLEEARRLYEAGKFAEAIIYLFSYELVELDKHQVIRLAKGKTNRQYLGEARSQPGVLPVLQDTMLAFEDVFFGRHPLERERFEACWRRLDDFRRSMQGAVA